MPRNDTESNGRPRKALLGGDKRNSFCLVHPVVFRPSFVSFVAKQILRFAQADMDAE